MKKILALVFLALFLTVPAYAGTPILSFDRLSLAAGIEKQVLPSGLQNAESWSGGIFGAYSVLAPDATNPNRPRISAIFRVTQAFDTAKQSEAFVGLRYTFKAGGVK